jgi:hypothetical protein
VKKALRLKDPVEQARLQRKIDKRWRKQGWLLFPGAVAFAIAGGAIGGTAAEALMPSLIGVGIVFGAVAGLFGGAYIVRRAIITNA